MKKIKIKFHKPAPGRLKPKKWDDMEPKTRDLLRSLCFLCPSLLGVIIFFVLPFGVVVYYSFTSSAVSGHFVFLKNFVELFHNKAFLIAARNTLKFSFTAVPLAVILALGLALIIEGVPVIALATQRDVYEKTLSNIKEVKARDAVVIGLAMEGDDQIEKYVDHTIFIPATDKYLAPILAVIPLQLLAYHAAVLRGTDVDKPRNLAKSVTVE